MVKVGEQRFNYSCCTYFVVVDMRWAGLAGFPYKEFGTVRNRMVTNTDIPLKGSILLAEVALLGGPKTTYDKQLACKTGISASAEVNQQRQPPARKAVLPTPISGR